MPRGGRGVDQTHVVYGDALIKWIVFMQKERGVSKARHIGRRRQTDESRETQLNQRPIPKRCKIHRPPTHSVGKHAAFLCSPGNVGRQSVLCFEASNSVLSLWQDGPQESVLVMPATVTKQPQKSSRGTTLSLSH